MKRILTIFFLATYLILSVGVTIVIHTCGGESEASLATTTAGDPCCCGTPTPMDGTCCFTTLTTIRLDEAQQAAIVDVDQSLAVVGFVPSSTYLFSDLQPSSIVLRNEYPPPREDITLRNSVLLI
jgi:hypothetical protein